MKTRCLQIHLEDEGSLWFRDTNCRASGLWTQSESYPFQLATMKASCLNRERARNINLKARRMAAPGKQLRSRKTLNRSVIEGFFFSFLLCLNSLLSVNMNILLPTLQQGQLSMGVDTHWKTIQWPAACLRICPHCILKFPTPDLSWRLG